MALTIPGTQDEEEKLTGTIGLTGSEGLKPTVDYKAAVKSLKRERNLAEADAYIANSIPETGQMPDYASAIKSLKTNRETNLKNSLKIASLADSEQAAAISDLSKQTGLAPSFIQGNVADVTRMVKLTSLDAGKLAEQSPILAKQLADPTFAAIAYDDIETLNTMESLVRGVIQTPRSIAAGVPAASGGLYQLFGVVPGSVDAILDAVGLDTEFSNDPDRFLFRNLLNVPQAISEGFQSLAEGQYELGAKTRGDVSMFSDNAQSFFMGFESIGMMAPGMAAFSLTGNPAFLYGIAGITAFGQSFTEALDQDLPYATSLLLGATQGTTEMAFEKLPALRYLSDTKLGTSFFKKWMTQLAIELPQEQLTTVFQEYNDFMILPSQADQTFGDYLRQRPNSAWHTLIATLSGVVKQQ